MNGIHDMGGMDGFGPINPEKDEPVFHASWEARIYALNMALGALGKWNLDRARYAREQMDPAEYLSLGYYETWLVRNERMLISHGVITREELERKQNQIRAAIDKVGG